MIEVRGRKIESLWLGPRQGPTLVFLHEGLGSVGLWRDFPQKVSDATGLGAFVYSRAGYGNSDPAPLPRPVHYMHDEAALLPEILQAAAVSDPILVGHSDGASIALIHAAGHAVRGLILEAPHVFTEDEGLASIARMRDLYATTDLRTRLARWHQNVDAAFLGWNGAWLNPEFKRTWNLEEFLPRIAAPVLIIQGTDDEYGSVKQIEAIQRGVKQTEVTLLQDCGHSPHRDQPEATLKAMAAFITKLI